jgi:hypothetical protein
MPLQGVPKKKTPRLHIDTYPNEKEYKEIKKKADELHMSLSQYLLFCGLNADIKVNIGGKEE